MPNEPATPAVSDDHFNRLKQLLHPPEPQVLELAILPSSTSLDIQYDANPPALGIPTSILLSCFLRARYDFFADCKQTFDGLLKPNEEESVRLKAGIFQVTSVILFWEPNHLTAANWRKQYLLNVSSNGTSEELDVLLRFEWTFLDSLLTSPLPSRHAKSPTLWFHRLWLLRTLGALSTRAFFSSAERELMDSAAGEAARLLWREELRIIMQAGDRHPKNYYAWTYARNLWNHIFNSNLRTNNTSLVKPPVSVCDDAGNPSVEGEVVWLESVEEIHRWCFEHPRDISGWSFFATLLKQISPRSYVMMPGQDVMPIPHATDLVQKTRESVCEATRQYRDKFVRNSESIEWFLAQLNENK